MGCITKHYLNEFSILGVWKIEEDQEALMKLVVLDNDEKKKYKGFSSNSRKLEFLSVRALLAELLGQGAGIVYNKNNKPFLRDGSRFISISHSHKLTAILLSSNEKVGIDLEYMSANITALAFKFLNRKEKITKINDYPPLMPSPPAAPAANDAPAQVVAPLSQPPACAASGARPPRPARNAAGRR